ncbi:hypothetical protein ACMGEI_08025 [Staphylococcus aureus]
MLITNILVQLFLISMLFTQSAYQFAFSLASSAILYPYMFSAFYQVKYTLEHRQQATTKHAPSTEIIKPIFTSVDPQPPTIVASTCAILGESNCEI